MFKRDPSQQPTAKSSITQLSTPGLSQLRLADATDGDSSARVAQACGGVFRCNVIDPDRRSGLGAGEILQLPGGAPDGENLGGEMPDFAVLLTAVAHRGLLPTGDVRRRRVEEPIKASQHVAVDASQVVALSILERDEICNVVARNHPDLVG